MKIEKTITKGIKVTKPFISGVQNIYFHNKLLQSLMI